MASAVDRSLADIMTSSSSRPRGPRPVSTKTRASVRSKRGSRLPHSPMDMVTEQAPPSDLPVVIRDPTWLLQLRYPKLQAGQPASALSVDRSCLPSAIIPGEAHADIRKSLLAVATKADSVKPLHIKSSKEGLRDSSMV